MKPFKFYLSFCYFVQHTFAEAACNGAMLLSKVILSIEFPDSLKFFYWPLFKTIK